MTERLVKWWKKYIESLERPWSHYSLKQLFDKTRLKAQETLPELSEAELLQQCYAVRNMDIEDKITSHDGYTFSTRQEAQKEAFNNIIYNKGCTLKVLEAVYRECEDILSLQYAKNDVCEKIIWSEECSKELFSKISPRLNVRYISEHPFSSSADLQDAIISMDKKFPPCLWSDSYYSYQKSEEEDVVYNMLKSANLSDENIYALARTARLASITPGREFLGQCLKDENCPEEFKKAVLDGEFYLLYQEVYIDGGLFYEIRDEQKLEKMAEMLQDKNLSCEYLEKIYHIAPCLYDVEYSRNNILSDIIKHPNCSDDLAQKAFLALEDDFVGFDEMASYIKKRNPSQTVVEYIQEKRLKNYISEMIEGTAPDERIEGFIKKIHKEIQKGNKKKVERLKTLLFSQGEDAVYKLDHQAVKWFINHGTKENLEALNSLRGLYGLRTEVEPYSHDDSDIVDIRRMQFSGYAEPTSKKWLNPETGEVEDNPHYERKHSDEFLNDAEMSNEEIKEKIALAKEQAARQKTEDNYGISTDENGRLYTTFAAVFEKMAKQAEKKGDARQAKKIRTIIDNSAHGFSEAYRSAKPDWSLNEIKTIYDLSKNKAYQKMKEAGVAFPEDKLKKALFSHRYKPEDVEKFNVTDLQQVYIECYGRDGKIPIQDYQEDAPQSVREEFWKKVAKNKELTEFISKDLISKGIDAESVERIWKNCKEYGSPCFIYPGCEDNVYGVSLQVHHIQALKDGGKNEMDNFVIVVDVREAKQIMGYDGDVLSRDGGCITINSHRPLHEYDNPLVYLYQGEDGKIINSDKERDDLPRLKILTYPSAPCQKGEHVLYYGGPGVQSCCVGKLNGHVRGAEYNIPEKNAVQQVIHQAICEHRR